MKPIDTRPDLDIIKASMTRGEYHNREDWGTTDPAYSAEAAIGVLIAEVEALRAASLPTPPGAEPVRELPAASTGSATGREVAKTVL